MATSFESCADVENYVKDRNNSESIFICPVIPEHCKTEKCILGVDEAGRGPVLGPMVYGICFCPESKTEFLTEVGCADSKSLTEVKREEIFEKLIKANDFLGWSVNVISPNIISNQMLKRFKCSLNQIAQDSTVALIQNVLQSGGNISEIYVDTVGPPEKYQDKLSHIFPGIKVTVSKKADAIYPIVSAASICAKVTRDKVISSWLFSEHFETPEDGFGSGYPNDPVTKTFLSTNMDSVFGFPQLVRFSWSTASKVLENAVPVEWEEEEEGSPHNSKMITSFFKQSSKKDHHETKHSFFSDRNLSSTLTF